MNQPPPYENRIKSRILSLLRQNNNSLAAVLLRQNLGLSSGIFEKHLQELRDTGYSIEAGADTCRITAEPDTPFAWEFPGREDRIHFFDQTHSTMLIAKDLAEQGCPHFTLVIADRQTRGRGRLQRIWHSEQGGLYFTLVLRPDLSIEDSHRLAFAASLTLAEILQQRFQVDARVKWPNDILINERKLSGMLTEMGVQGSRLSFVNIGIGINCNNDPTGIAPPATSLLHLTGRRVNRRLLLAAFLDAFEERLTATDLSNIIDQWKRRTVTLGRRVTIQTSRDRLTGIARDVNAGGALVLEQADGSLREVIYGDCFHSPIEKS